MNPIAQTLNGIIEEKNPNLIKMLSDTGKNLFFPKGILSQSAEAKEKAHRLNATIGIATERGGTMHLASIMESIRNLRPEESLTYAPSFGIPLLRKKWQNSIVEKNPSLAGKQISLPIVTCGITHALSMFGDIWLDPGDVIVMPEMMWGNYNMIFTIRRGARISHFTLFSETGGFNIAGFEKKVRTEAEKNGKVAVLFNFPHNPTGYTASVEEGKRIVGILANIAGEGKKVIAVTDDSYFGLFYEDKVMRESLFADLAGLHPNLLAIKLDGATKENFVWGLRIGFITYGVKAEGNLADLYDALERKTAGSIRGSISNASHLGQSIVLKSLNSNRFQVERKEKFNILKSRAARVKKVLSDDKYKDAWDVYPFNSGYFMCIRLKSVDAETLRVHLLNKYGVGLIAMGKRDLRVAFSCLEEDDVPELFDTVLMGIKDLS